MLINKIKQLFPIFVSTGITHELLKKNNNQHLIQKPDFQNHTIEMGRMGTSLTCNQENTFLKILSRKNTI